MSLREKLQNTQRNRPPPINWEHQKKLWVEAVENLYVSVTQDWFGDLIRDGLLKMDLAPLVIVEEHIGTYQIDKLELRANEACVVFEPVGRNIVGGDGRVDLYLKGEYAKGCMLILVMEDARREWHLIDRTNKRERSLLTKESLEGLLEEWLP